MSIFAIGDLHLSEGCNKPMDIFVGWNNYEKRIKANWTELVKPSDTVVIAGDISWGMTLEQAKADFEFIEKLPGKKVLLKGNHDYWWSSKKKMEEFFSKNGFDSLAILHNNCIIAENIALCGTRGWMLEDTTEHDHKVTAREEGRLILSLNEAVKTGLEPVVFLHYPPVYGDAVSGKMVDIMLQYGVKRCYYGHLHGASCRQAIEGKYLGIDFSLISADHLNFCPKSL